MRRRSIPLLALVLLGGCGPTDQQVGVAILSSLVAIVPIAAGINLGLHRLWRERRQLLEPTWPEAMASSLAAGVLTIAFNVWVDMAGQDLFLLAFWLVGTTYLTLLSLGIGIALLSRRRWAFRGIYWLPAVMIVAAALPMALDATDESYAEVVVLLVTYIGGLGGIGGISFMILLGISTRVWKAARRESRERGPVEF